MMQNCQTPVCLPESSMDSLIDDQWQTTCFGDKADAFENAPEMLCGAPTPRNDLADYWPDSERFIARFQASNTWFLIKLGAL